MSRILVAMSLVLLTACATTREVVVETRSAPNFFWQIAQRTVELCRYEVDYEVAIRLANTFVAGLDTVDIAAGELCIAATRARRGIRTVRGIPLRGRFVM